MSSTAIVPPVVVHSRSKQRRQRSVDATTSLPLRPPLARTVAASFDCGLKCWSVCRMNECSWCQPRPITRYTTLTQCLAACPTPASNFAAGKEEEGMPPPPPRYSQRAAALSFLCAFYSFRSSYIQKNQQPFRLRPDY